MRLILPPKEIRFEITYQCNMHCKHCYNNSGFREINELSTDEIISVLKQADHWGVREFFLKVVNH